MSMIQRCVDCSALETRCRCDPDNLDWSNFPGQRGAVPLVTVAFDAFKVSDDRTYMLGHIMAKTIGEALNGALAGYALFHKDTLLIRETSEKGVKVHVYGIKKKATPRWVHKDHVSRRVHDLYAAPVCIIDGSAMLPAEIRQ